MMFLTRRLDPPSVLALAVIGIWCLALASAAFVMPQGWTTTARGTPAEGDYLGFYAAGELAKRGEAASAYSLERHRTAERALDRNPDGGFYPWPYPPTFLLVAAVLTLLPYSASMLAWTLSTFALFAAAISRISASRRDMLLMLATPAPWINLYIGQNGALTASLMGFGLLLLETRPLAAGVALGCLSLKPHLGVLVPVALLAGGYYRAFAAAALTAVAIAAVSVAAFGTGPWLVLPAQVSHVASLLETSGDTQKIQSVFGLSRALGFSAASALWLQAAVSLLLVALIGRTWHSRSISFDLKAAMLAAAATLATPYQFAYDLVILTVAQAFLLRHFAGRSIPRTDAYLLLLANGCVMLFSCLPPYPLGVFGSVLVIGIVVRHAWSEAAARLQNPQNAEKLIARGPVPALRSRGT